MGRGVTCVVVLHRGKRREVVCVGAVGGGGGASEIEGGRES